MKYPRFQWAVLAIAIVLCCRTVLAKGPNGGADVDSSAMAIAAEVDRLILAELEKVGIRPAEQCNDDDFLRRASLDIAGQLPSSSAVIEFRSNQQTDKREKLIERMIDSPEFGMNWARYWRDVIYMRATEQRSRLNQEEFTNWMAERWNKDAGWDQTVSSMLTAAGNVQEHPETALIFAQGAIVEDVTAEACRIFLGVQLQCANCHDHPSDVWKREQFHQLAAYFPRISERRNGDTKPPTFEIVSVNAEVRRGEFMHEHPDLFVAQFDRNRDKKVSREELKMGPKAKRKKKSPAMAEMKMEEVPASETKLNAKLIERLFDAGDSNKDGLLSIEEIRVMPAPEKKKRGNTEHHMVDLQHPDSLGTVIDPKFFVDGSALPHGQTDQERRAAVSKAFTSTENPWFARAIVNRVWAEMLGEGFYMPIDDMGPTRTARYPEAMEKICQGFVANHYSPKWLVRTVANTAAYQRKIQSRPVSENDLPFASASPVPLRSDVIFNSLTQVFGVTDTEMGGNLGRPKKGDKKDMADKPRAYLQSPRYQFDNLFGADPSTPKDDITGNIPQSLLLMNGRNIRSGMSAKGDTRLVKILKEHKDNRGALRELYLVVLNRDPSDKEYEICTQYLAEVKPRAEAYEDLMWSLLNSSEFISRR